MCKRRGCIEAAPAEEHEAMLAEKGELARRLAALA